MNRSVLIAGLIFLGAALVFFNQGIKKSAAPDHDEDAQTQQSQAQKAPTKTTPVDPNAVLLPEEAVGNPAAAKHHIEVGWVYDDENQSKPETLTVPIQAIRDYVAGSGSAVSAEIVNLDVPVADRSPAARAVTDLGVRVDGQYLYGGNLSGAPLSSEGIRHALDGAITKK